MEIPESTDESLKLMTKVLDAEPEVMSAAELYTLPVIVPDTGTHFAELADVKSYLTLEKVVDVTGPEVSV